MVEGLYSAASGMAAQEQQLDAIGNDLANQSSSGYKSERIGFSDLLYNQVNLTGTHSDVGAGARAQEIGRDESEGSVQQTGNPLDLAIEGEGFFQVKLSNGSTALTRNGTFGVDANGQITDAEGNFLQPPIKLPAGATPSEVQISTDGTVSLGGRKLGQIGLVTVPAPEHLLDSGGGLLTPTSSSGAPQAQSASKIQQGALESSNVDVASEMAKMISTQRSYQLASSAIQTESQMMSIANQLRS